MPWCDSCSKYYAPNGLNPDGTCPSCGRLVAEPSADADVPVRAPWHFKLLVASAAAYLAWRAWQGVAWVLDHV